MAKGIVWGRIFKNLIDALKGMDGTSVASTTVDATSAADQKVLCVTATTDFVTSKAVMVDEGTANEEIIIPASIQAGVSLTAVDDLDFEHVNADAVKQGWYNYNYGERVYTGKINDLAWNGPFPIVGVKVGVKIPVESLTGFYEEITCPVTIDLWIAVEKDVINDQTNDDIRDKLEADFARAIMTDWARDGHATNTRKTNTTPLDADDAFDPEADIPLIGVSFTVEIDYREKIGGIYQ